MSHYLPMLVCLLMANVLIAQCPVLELGAFQQIQRTEGPEKEAKILAQGFDLHSDFVLGGKKMRRFNKCWKGNAGKARYEQVLLWNSSANQVMLLLSDEAQYQTMRTMFRYQYSVQQLDAEPYFAIGIAFK